MKCNGTKPNERQAIAHGMEMKLVNGAQWNKQNELMNAEWSVPQLRNEILFHFAERIEK